MGDNVSKVWGLANRVHMSLISRFVRSPNQATPPYFYTNQLFFINKNKNGEKII